jgi:ATP-dependent RNA helicase RhlE
MTFCNQEEYGYLVDVEKLIWKKITIVEDHPFEIKIDTNNTTKPKRWGWGGRGGSRGGWRKTHMTPKSGDTGRNRNVRRAKNKRS